MLDYLVQFAIGGILFSGLYYFAKQKQEWIMSIIIAIPIRIIASYVYTFFTVANMEKVLNNSSITIFVTLMFVILMTLLLKITNKHIAFLLGFVFWITGISIVTTSYLK